VAPTITAPQSAPIIANGGTEYFLAARGPINFTLRLFAVTNTQSLTTATPALSVASTFLLSTLYVQPPEASQPDQVGPLGQSLGVTTAPKLETDADVISAPMVLSQGQLWATLSTAVIDQEFNINAGAVFFGITPGATNLFQSRVTVQGYVVAPTLQTNLIYPSIAMNSVGQGAIGFTLVGPNDFPSAAFVPLASDGTLGAVTVSAAGTAAEDGFSGYPPNGPTFRWGDYSATAIDPATGSIWLNAEYIPNLPRNTNTNWGTFLTHYTP
jgi:hypothetical protein